MEAPHQLHQGWGTWTGDRSQRGPQKYERAPQVLTRRSM